MYLFTRVTAIFSLAVGSLGVAKAGSEIAPQAVIVDPPATSVESSFGNPLLIEYLAADQHSSEVSLPQLPDTPAGLPTYDGEGGPEPTLEYLSTTTTTIPAAPEDTRVWTGSIPEIYGEGSGCTQEEANIIARAMWDQGATDDSVKKMLRIVSRESLCDPSAHNGNTRTRDDSWGLCQQNNLSGWFDEGKLLENYDRFAFADNFAYNAESCALMWSVCSVGPWNYGNYYCSTPRELR